MNVFSGSAKPACVGNPDWVISPGKLLALKRKVSSISHLITTIGDL